MQVAREGIECQPMTLQVQMGLSAEIVVSHFLGCHSWSILYNIARIANFVRYGFPKGCLTSTKFRELLPHYRSSITMFPHHCRTLLSLLCFSCIFNSMCQCVFNTQTYKTSNWFLLYFDTLLVHLGYNFEPGL